MRSIPTRLRAAILVLPLALTVSAGCDIAMADFAEKETAEWRKTYELSPGGRVEIGNVNGRIKVRSGEGNTVEVVALKTAKAGSVDAAKQTLGRIEIRESSSPDGIKVDTHFDRASSSMFSHYNWQVEYTVRVPVAANVKLSTVNGGVEITGVSGRVVAEATNGGVMARGISGTIEALNHQRRCGRRARQGRPGRSETGVHQRRHRAGAPHRQQRRLCRRASPMAASTLAGCRSWRAVRTRSGGWTAI